ncbi:MAG: hypothetical protein HFJ11_07420, partial [Bacilli bacterium]|nr:hypothetical protein [Bacilli bacterium]
RKKGMFICVEGQLTNSGEISMTARGAKAKGQDVYLLRNKDNSYEYVPAVGATGGAGVRAVSNTSTPIRTYGNKGKDGINRQTGGGGSGIATATGYKEYSFGSTIQKTATAVSGGGTTGTSYSGGTGGGSGNIRKGYSHTTGELTYGTNGSGGQANGGAGGKGDINGIGNPPGGTGGLLIIYSNKLENNNKMNSNGVGIGNSGASGGGSINIFYEELINEGIVEATGGNSSGLGNGGNGTVTIENINKSINNPNVDDLVEFENNLESYWPLKDSLENKKSEYNNLSIYSGNNLKFEQESAYISSTVLATEKNYLLPEKFTIMFKYKPVEELKPWTLIFGKNTSYSNISKFNGLFIHNTLDKTGLFNGYEEE